MIIFDLRCSNGHEFEGWFKDYQDFENQIEQGLLSCPVCSDCGIEKVLSPLSVLNSREKGEDDLAARRRLVEKVYDFLDRNFENVGPDFAKVALKMHYGAEERRNIQGTTTEHEEKLLRKEGVEFLKIPLPPRPDDTELH